MSLQSAPYYWAVCDGCGRRCDYDEYAAWSDVGQAIDEAIARDWYSVNDKQHCPECGPLCEKCGAPAGDEAGERDYHCGACWAELEAKDGAA